MISELKLTNFRKHEDLSVKFSKGLNIISSNNESGKSSLLEGISYALFGSNGLSEPLADVVTYDLPVSSMKVEVTLVTDKEYKITRSKSGAEVISDDKVLVTGQREVTSFIEEMFGIPTGKAKLLTIAEQGDIRGVLTDGPTAAASFIEKMADFSEIDHVIEMIQTKLPVGNVSLDKENISKHEEKLEEELESLEELRNNDVGDLKKRVSIIDDQVARFDAEMSKISDKLVEIDTKNKIVEKERTKLEEIKSQLAAKELELSKLTKPSQVDPPNKARLRELSDIISQGQETLSGQKQYQDFLNLKTCEDVWDEGLESFTQEIITTENTLIKLRNDLQESQTEKKVLESKLLDVQETCPTCGQAVPDAEVLIRKNKKTQDKISLCERAISELEGEIADTFEYSATLKTIMEVFQCQETFLDGEPLVKIDNSVIPHEIEWVGATNYDEEQKKLDNFIEEYDGIILQESKYEEYKRDMKGFEINSKSLTESVESLESVIRSFPSFDTYSTEELQVKFDSLLSDKQNSLSDKQELVSQIDLYLGSIEIVKGSIENTKNRISELKSEIEGKEKANLLLKDVKKARLEVCASVWNKVLITASSYFSKMRGVKSNITKTIKGFEVDGRSAAGLSGSTLDILGLAFRLAQSDIFLAGSFTVFLDEPGAGADEDRSSLMMSLIKEAVSKQSIVITHRSTDLNFCDNLIEL